MEMIENHAASAIQSAIYGEMTFCKFLSANDAGATGSHQVGVLVSKSAKPMLFDQRLEGENILKKEIEIHWHDQLVTQSCITYYRSKNEFRITRFGRDFPYLNPDKTGALFVFTKRTLDLYVAYILETEDEIEQFLDAFGISPTETNGLIDTSQSVSETRESLAINNFIMNLTEDFPPSITMANAAREIQHLAYHQTGSASTNPDRKIIEWTKVEYALFRSLEKARYGEMIRNGFSNVDEFITVANKVLNRRKSRAGRSLEHHLAAIFEDNHIRYTAQARTEGKKRPDFLFPSEEAYHDMHFPLCKLTFLAAKTTCKDRWRQIINEAERLKNGTKYLCTLQQGISPAQMDEMQAEKVVLVVPKTYIRAYPTDRQERIWTLAKFLNYLKELERS